MTPELERMFVDAMNMDEQSRTAFMDEVRTSDPANFSELAELVDDAAAAGKFFDILGDAVFASSDSYEDSPGLPDPRPSLTAGETIRHYRILSVISRGGMGTVYRARDTRLERDVALKFLPPHAYAEHAAQEQLLREARAVAALNHPNVCAIYEIGETADDSLYIAMPCYEGDTLKARLKTSTLAIDEALSIAIQVARGLAAAHARGIIHRDVKPGNILVSPDGEVRLLDFGLALMEQGSLGTSGTIRGTVAYMSPEQAQGEVQDAQSDLWALGVVLYEMIAGTRPFNGPTTHQIIQSIIRDDPLGVSAAREDVPGPVSHVIDKLLKKDRSLRYGSALEVITDLVNARTHARRWRPRKFAVALTIPVIAVLISLSMWLSSRTTPAVRTVTTTRNVAAHELYVHGSDPVLLRSDSGARAAFKYLSQAIALDSGYSAAYSGLAFLHLRIGFGGSDSVMTRRERLSLAEHAATKALSLDSTSGDPHLAMAMVRRNNYQMARAEEEMQRAIALDPKKPLYHEKLSALYSMLGRHRQALKEAQRAVELDSLSPGSRAELANALMTDDRCDEALAELAKLRSLRPPLLRAGGMSALCYARKGMWPESIAAARGIIADGGPRASAILAYVLARSGQNREAVAILHALIDRATRTRSNAFDVAIAYTGMGDMDNAFAWLSKAVDDRSFGFDWISPVEMELRKDARFAGIARRVGISTGP
jgi:serine/threonine-protein kinase